MGRSNIKARREDTVEAARQAMLEHLDAVRPETDRVLQEVVDDVRALFGVGLCMLNLALLKVQYFRAWSGRLPPVLAAARQNPRERSMCRYVVDEEMPLVVEDFLESESFSDQYFCVNYGLQFYAGVPLVTSGGETIGTLCLLHTKPRKFGDKEIRTLSAFARAAVGRLELLGALATRQRFVSMVSHELRTPLLFIKGYLEALLVNEAGPLNEEQREYAEVSYRNATRLQAIADDLLPLSTLDSYEGLEKLFEPYTRVDSGTTRYIQGTELGLAISRQIITLHSGNIWAESEPGAGSTFLGVGTLRGGTYLRLTAVLLIVGGVVAFFPLPLVGIIFSIAVTWLGFMLFTEQVSSDGQPSRVS